MDPASEELERRSRYLSALVRRTKHADLPQPEPEVAETKADSDAEAKLKAPPPPHASGDGKRGKAGERTAAVWRMACVVLELMAEGLGIGTGDGDGDALARLVTRADSDCMLRVNHYPPRPAAPELNLTGFGNHHGRARARSRYGDCSPAMGEMQSWMEMLTYRYPRAPAMGELGSSGLGWQPCLLRERRGGRRR